MFDGTGSYARSSVLDPTSEHECVACALTPFLIRRISVSSLLRFNLFNIILTIGVSELNSIDFVASTVHALIKRDLPSIAASHLLLRSKMVRVHALISSICARSERFDKHAENHATGRHRSTHGAAVLWSMGELRAAGDVRVLLLPTFTFIQLIP